MCNKMDLQMFASHKSFSTNNTLMRSFTIVLFKMNFKMRTCYETFITNIADVIADIPMESGKDYRTNYLNVTFGAH